MRNVLMLMTLLAGTAAFAVTPSKPLFGLRPAASPPLHALRGGNVQSSLAGVLSGAMAVPAASGIAAVACSLCYIRQAYVFSLSYGLAMAGIGGAVLLTSPASTLVTAHAALVAAYGARLFGFLFWRQRFQPSYDGTAKLKKLDKTPRLQRTPAVLSTALFYGLMSSPLLFHLQAAPLAGLAGQVSGAGCAVAALGLAYEAVADQQKSIYKIGLRAAGKDDELYVGGVWARSRHANYYGELVFWCGSFVAGLPALFAAGVPLYVRALKAASSGLGLAGIFFIMLSATKRLEGIYDNKYRKVGGVPTQRYDAYFASSNALIPKVL